LNWLDILILVSVAVSVIVGLTTGIVRSVINLAGLLLGICFASQYYAKVGSWLSFISNESVSNVVGFVLIVVVAMLIAVIISAIIRKVLSSIFLTWLDRLIGAAVGFIIGVSVWRAILALWVKYFTDSMLQSSWVAELILERIPLALASITSGLDVIKKIFLG